MTNREIISNFRNLTDKTHISDDSGWSTRLVFRHLLKYRSLLLSEKKRANRKLNTDNYQTICVPLEEVDVVDYPSVPPSGCTWLKSVLPIPKVIQGYLSVMSLANNETFDYIRWQDIEDKQYSRKPAVTKESFFTEKVTDNGTFIYITNKDFLKSVQLTAMAYNPIEFQLFQGCGNNEKNKCVPYLDLEFVLDPDLLSPMFDMALERIYRYKQNAPADLLNNDDDDIKPNPNSLK